MSNNFNTNPMTQEELASQKELQRKINERLDESSGVKQNEFVSDISTGGYSIKVKQKDGEGAKYCLRTIYDKNSRGGL